MCVCVYVYLLKRVYESRAGMVRSERGWGGYRQIWPTNIALIKFDQLASPSIKESWSIYNQFLYFNLIIRYFYLSFWPSSSGFVSQKSVSWSICDHWMLSWPTGWSVDQLVGQMTNVWSNDQLAVLWTIITKNFVFKYGI